MHEAFGHRLGVFQDGHMKLGLELVWFFYMGYRSFWQCWGLCEVCTQPPPNMEGRALIPYKLSPVPAQTSLQVMYIRERQGLVLPGH